MIAARATEFLQNCLGGSGVSCCGSFGDYIVLQLGDKLFCISLLNELFRNARHYSEKRASFLFLGRKTITCIHVFF